MIAIALSNPIDADHAQQGRYPLFFFPLSFSLPPLTFSFLSSLSKPSQKKTSTRQGALNLLPRHVLTRMARRRAASRRPALARRASAAALAVAAVAFLLGRALPFPSPSSAVSFRFAAAQPITYADLLSNLPDSKSPKIDDEKPATAAAAAAAKPAASSKFATGDELVPKARAAAAGSETAAASTTAARSDGNAGAAASRAGTSAAEDLAAKRNAGGQDKLAPIGGSASVAAAPAPAAPTPAGAPAPPPPPPPPSDPKSLALAAATAAARGETRPAAPAGPALGAVSAGGGPGVAAAGTLVGAAAAREAPSAPAAGNLPVAGAGAAAAGVAPRGGVALPNGMTVLTKADADALLSLRDAVANWDELVGWGLKGWSPNSNPCAGWTGVSCSNAKRVIGVDLSGWMVKGTLPAELALLDELRTFNASDCDLTGGLPIGWAANGAFPRLSVLDLSNNARLAAEVPGRVGRRARVPVADGAWRSATPGSRRRSTRRGRRRARRWPSSPPWISPETPSEGSLPAAFGSGGTLTKLRTLLLNNNSIAGTLPKEWGSDNETLPSLSVLDLSRNVLEGRLPKPLGLERRLLAADGAPSAGQPPGRLAADRVGPRRAVPEARVARRVRQQARGPRARQLGPPRRRRVEADDAVPAPRQRQALRESPAAAAERRRGREGRAPGPGAAGRLPGARSQPRAARGAAGRRRVPGRRPRRARRGHRGIPRRGPAAAQEAPQEGSRGPGRRSRRPGL